MVSKLSTLPKLLHSICVSSYIHKYLCIVIVFLMQKITIVIILIKHIMFVDIYLHKYYVKIM